VSQRDHASRLAEAVGGDDLVGRDARLFEGEAPGRLGIGLEHPPDQRFLAGGDDGHRRRGLGARVADDDGKYHHEGEGACAPKHRLHSTAGRVTAKLPAWKRPMGTV
jgi:hypothetical protein